MPTITKSIGTTGRQYSTISAWEADLDNGTVYAAGDDAVGECYDDSAFDESVVANGGGTIGLNSRTLRTASGHAHDGTAGTGVRIVRSVNASDILSSGVAVLLTVQDIEFNANDREMTQVVNYHQGSASIYGRFNRLLIHKNANNGNAAGLRLEGASWATNCIIYRIRCTGGSSGAARGLYYASSARAEGAINCTVHNVVANSSTGVARCFDYTDNSTKTAKNCIGTDPSGTTTGAKQCFSASTVVQVSNNLSSDTTATGTGSLTSKTSANQFVSTTVGSEDLHLKAGADAIDAGTDLGTTPTGVNLDIDGRDRDAEGDTWDIGADEYVAVGGSAKPWLYRSHTHTLIARI